VAPVMEVLCGVLSGDGVTQDFGHIFVARMAQSR
jgi:hypothetical protein